MGLKPGSRSPASLVNNYIGTAYDNVKTVADNIDDVMSVSSALGEDFPEDGLDTIAENIEGIKTVSEITDEVVTIAGINDEVVTVSGIEDEVVSVASNIGDVVLVATNIDEVVTVAGIKDEVVTVAGIEQEIHDVPSYTAQAIDAAASAEEDAIIAANGADRSEQEADRAEVAADAAALSGNKYDDTAAGIAGTVDGEYFSVVSENDNSYLDLYKNERGVAAFKKSYPSGDYVDKLYGALGENEISSKNIFNPGDINTGFQYRNTGGVRPNSIYRVTKKYPITEGQFVSVSGFLETQKTQVDPYIHFWDENDELVEVVKFPDYRLPTNYLSIKASIGVVSFSVNLPPTPSSLPKNFQIEMSERVTDYERYDSFSDVSYDYDTERAVTNINENNIFDGSIMESFRLLNDGISVSVSNRDVTSTFIPVEFGETYVISGLEGVRIPIKSVGTSPRKVLGFSRDDIVEGNVGVQLDGYTDDPYVFTVTEQSFKFIVIVLSTEDSGGTVDSVNDLKIQIEKGNEPTKYKPRFVPVNSASIYDELNRLDSDVEELSDTVENLKGYEGSLSIGALVEMDSVLEYSPITEKNYAKGVGPFGVTYSMSGEDGDGANGNNMYTKIESIPEGETTIAVQLKCKADGASTLPKVDANPINVPSGQFDNPDTLPYYDGRYPLDNYTHPSGAYDATGIAGYKYWLVASVLPGSTANVTWEDEDLMVSNDGVTWERVQSLYESTKDYTTTTLRLPPNDFAVDARRNGFLPSPEAGDVLEVSSPADNGNPEVDRETVTITGLPFKHDPLLITEGGYVYVYHSFNLPYNNVSSNGAYRYIVLVRSGDGVNWEVVRSDGSTMALNSSADTRKIFTKDELGRNNFLHFAFSTGNSNPEIVKYGDGDFEFIYGYNFSRRHKGTTPWNFDFTTSYPFQDLGSGNHPGIEYIDGKTIVVNSDKAFYSTNRGETFEEYPYYPLWVGSVSNLPYKKSIFKGPNGSVIVVDTKRLTCAAEPLFPQLLDETYALTHFFHKIFSEKFDRELDFISYAESGYNDAYIDVQIDIINDGEGTRSLNFRNYIGNTETTTKVNNPHQLIGILDYTAKKGDVVHMYITSTSRGNGSVSVGDIQVIKDKK